MLPVRRIAAAGAALTLSLGLVACSVDSENEAKDGEGEKIVISHAFGETVINGKPERVATIDYANQEVPLALGIVPVGMSKMTWGDDDQNGIQPWVEDKLEELDADEPVLFDESDGYDFEAIDGTQPDVILAGYSGMTKEDYETLSKIAPVVPFPEGGAPWATSWRDSLLINAKGLGMEKEGKKLIAQMEDEIDAAVEANPEIEGKNAAFLTHIDTTDLSEVNFYSAEDTRARFLEDLGLETAPSIVENTKKGQYSGSISTENADQLSDIDVIVTYGGPDLVEALKADPVLSQLPVVKSGAIVNLYEPTDPAVTAANPTVLSFPALLDSFAKSLADAVKKNS
ncbi:MAG: iron-siderophore ABC transporter substrate-binding protein [Nocardioidaceae bacterium]|nr:iron-siderophore ABC transporter substrate-binding protein [Nocardioidaceae bacterium]